jgi:hypothetical protein
MRQISSLDSAVVVKQGIFEYIERLENWFIEWGIVNDTCRVSWLKQGMKETTSKAMFESWFNSRQYQLTRNPGWVECRQGALHLFAPVSWIRDTIGQWRDSMVQGALPASIWLQRFAYWYAVIETLMPQHAVTPPFAALILRAGVAPAIEDELSRRDFMVYDPDAVTDEIKRAGDKIQHSGSMKKSAPIESNRIEAGADVELHKLAESS